MLAKRDSIQASARYTPEETTWVKIKNRQYSQAVGRHDFSTSAIATERRRDAAHALTRPSSCDL
jgi:hypothetical protein